MSIAERLESIADYFEELQALEDAGVLRKAIAHIRDLEARVPQWVSVEERLPEIPEGKHGMTIILGKFHGSDRLDWDIGDAVYTKDGKFLELYLHGDGKSWSQEESAIPPTHWMYRPQPPSQEEV